MASEPSLLDQVLAASKKGLEDKFQFFFNRLMEHVQATPEADFVASGSDRRSMEYVQNRFLQEGFSAALSLQLDEEEERYDVTISLRKLLPALPCTCGCKSLSGHVDPKETPAETEEEISSDALKEIPAESGEEISPEKLEQAREEIKGLILEQCQEYRAAIEAELRPKIEAELRSKIKAELRSQIKQREYEALFNKIDRDYCVSHGELAYRLLMNKIHGYY